jgi:hypothetical protein
MSERPVLCESFVISVGEYKLFPVGVAHKHTLRWGVILAWE